MFKKQSEQRWKAREPQGAVRTPAVWDVLIGRDGRVVIGGEDFPVPDGEPLHVAVLDAMQHVARTRGEPVQVVIIDEQEEHATHIEVGPDGSSRLVEEPPGSITEVLPPVEPESWPVPVPVPEPEAGPEAVAEGRTAPAASPTASPAVPDELAALVTGIRRALDTGAPERASALAFRLREHARRSFGAEHPFALEALELEAFATYQCGNFPGATALCLELAQMRHSRSDPRAHEDLARAAAAWSLIQDLPTAVKHGRALLAAWSRQGGGGVDTEVVNRIIHRIHAFSTGDAAPETSHRVR